MSLWIDVDTVTEVLLADGWHKVAGKSFDLDSYEYLNDDLLIHGGGQNGVCASGFRFTTPAGDQMCGPLTSILAVKRVPSG